jgi:hypothetical protein
MKRGITYRHVGGLILLLFLLPIPSAAQQDTTQKPTITETRSFGADSAASEFTMTKNPTLAILYSIVPGGGQLYNEDPWWKPTLFFGAAAFFAVRTVYYHDLFIEKADQVDALPDTDVTRSALVRQREFYRDNRDLNFAYFLGVEILNMIDAYVGAHLFDFDVDDDLSSRFYLDPQRYGVGVVMRW